MHDCNMHVCLQHLDYALASNKLDNRPRGSAIHLLLAIGPEQGEAVMHEILSSLAVQTHQSLSSQQCPEEPTVLPKSTFLPPPQGGAQRAD